MGTIASIQAYVTVTLRKRYPLMQKDKWDGNAPCPSCKKLCVFKKKENGERVLARHFSDTLGLCHEGEEEPEGSSIKNET